MNEKIKNFFTCIGVFFAGIATSVFGFYINRKKRLGTDNAICERVTGEITEVREQLADSRDEIRELTERCNDVSAIIRKYEDRDKQTTNEK